MKKVNAKGIDISYCQTNVDFKKIKADGYSFVILKLANARDRGITIDEQFENHYKGAISAGLDIGVYVYSLVTSAESAKACATETIKALKDKTIAYPVWFDIEYEEFYMNCGKDVNTAIVKEFCLEIEKQGYYAGVYASKSYFDSYLNDDELKRFDHWIAQYSSQCTYDGIYGMWQCGVAGHPEWDNQKIGKVSGVNGECDVNYAYYDYPARIKSFNCNNLVKKPEKEAPANPKPQPQKPSPAALKLGDKVKVKAGAKTYDGEGLADFVYNEVYEVLQVGTAGKEDYIVIGKGGEITAGVRAGDLIKL